MSQTTGQGKKVIIMGGGIAGLSAAHELMERGFEVHVYEYRSVVGGKARSSFGDRLPGEHGFRFFPGFYRHVIDTMSRIPSPAGGCVADHLVSATRVAVASSGSAPLINCAGFPHSLADLTVALRAMFDNNLPITTEEKETFAARLWQILTSSPRRRRDEYDKMSWWNYMDAPAQSEAYQKYFVVGLTRTLVAAKAEEISTKTGGNILIQLILDMMKPWGRMDRLLDGPTSDVWLHPWRDYLQGQPDPGALKARGLTPVQFHLGRGLKHICCVNGSIDSVIIGDGETSDNSGDPSGELLSGSTAPQPAYPYVLVDCEGASPPQLVSLTDAVVTGQPARSAPIPADSFQTTASAAGFKASAANSEHSTALLEPPLAPVSETRGESAFDHQSRTPDMAAGYAGQDIQRIPPSDSAFSAHTRRDKEHAELVGDACSLGDSSSILVQGEIVRGDYYIAALPVEVMSANLTPTLLEADPTLNSINDLQDHVRWMNGIQFYLAEDVPLVHGHVSYIDSPWALTSISQRQFWPDFSMEYGTGSLRGRIRGILSVDVSDWETAALVPPADWKWPQQEASQTGEIVPVTFPPISEWQQQKAADCTPSQVAAGVWKQLKDCINVEGALLLRDETVCHYYLCPDHIYTVKETPPPEGAAEQGEPLLVNAVGTWGMRPDAFTQIPNLFLASDYVRTFTDLATMEGANEAARRAVNRLMQTAKVSPPYCRLWDLHEPLLFAPARFFDYLRYMRGLSWKFDVNPRFLLMIMRLLMAGAALTHRMLNIKPSPLPWPTAAQQAQASGPHGGQHHDD